MILQQELVNDERFKRAFEGITIYGVAGAIGSGKDTVLNILGEYGFFVSIAGDNLRQISVAALGTTQRGGNNSPVGKIANMQRATYPGGMVSIAMIDYWARVLHMPKEFQPKGLAVGAIRSISEAQTIKKFGGKIIVVDADPRVRHQRIVGRGRTYEKQISFEQFMQEDEAEMGRGETDPTKFSLAQVMAMADIRIDNSRDNLDSFKANVREKLGLL